MSGINRIPKIDIHAHATMFKDYFPPHWQDDVLVSPEELLEMYDRLGIQRGVLLPVSAPESQPSVLSSESCKFLADKFPDRFSWFCNVDPRASLNTADGDLTYLLEHYKALGAKGVGEITCLLPADDPKVMNLFAACENCDMSALIHISTSQDHGYGIYDEPGLPRLEKVLQAFPGLKLIGHSSAFWSELSGNSAPELRGKWQKGKVHPGGRIPELMRRYPNLYCDVSAGSGHNAMMRDPEFTVLFLEEFQDRIMLGHDICHKTDTHPFKFRVFLEEMLDSGKLKEEIYRKVVRENAIRILKLEE